MEQAPELPKTYLPATEKDLYSYLNKATGKIEQIDLRTGKVFESYLPMKVGEFCNQTADLICGDIIKGKTLKETLQAYRIDYVVFYKWLAIFPEFNMRYSEARKQRADYHFYKALNLADSAVDASKEFIPGLKLAVDTHKWAAEKSDPERFAKFKEEGNTSIGSVIINLQTGVLDKHPPKDIVVDQFGHFQGFGVSLEETVVEAEEVIILKKERWEIPDEGRQEEKISVSDEVEGEKPKQRRIRKPV